MLKFKIKTKQLQNKIQPIEIKYRGIEGRPWMEDDVG